MRFHETGRPRHIVRAHGRGYVHLLLPPLPEAHASLDIRRELFLVSRVSWSQVRGLSQSLLLPHLFESHWLHSDLAIRRYQLVYLGLVLEGLAKQFLDILVIQLPLHLLGLNTTCSEPPWPIHCLHDIGLAGGSEGLLVGSLFGGISLLSFSSGINRTGARLDLSLGRR